MSFAMRLSPLVRAAPKLVTKTPMATPKRTLAESAVKPWEKSFKEAWLADPGE